MTGNRRNSPPAASAAGARASTSAAPSSSATSKATAKYTNKDGSKFITVPISPATETNSQAPTAVSNSVTNGAQNGPTSTVSNGLQPSVNRKKAKRRAKAAAKAEAGAISGGIKSGPPPSTILNGESLEREQPQPVYEEVTESGDEGTPGLARNENAAPMGNMGPGATKSKKTKKKKKKKDAASTPGDAVASGDGHAAPGSTDRNGSTASKEKIWNTTSQEERVRIKEFWLDLSEEERKSLVKVEKDTVLKKMKEQQKLTCSCHFCGRKRTAIEEELEGLYDSYYEELENFAHDPDGQQGRAPPLMAPSNHFGPSRVLHSPAQASAYASQLPSRGRIIEHIGEDDDDEGDEAFLDDDDDELAAEDDDSDADEDEIPSDDIHRDYSSDFFNFGNSLQVHGGILTVADDLLKNDGRKFIEMMEQLAERRMAREEDAKDHFTNRGAFVPEESSGTYDHNHHPPSDEDDYGPEDDEDEEYDSQDDDYDDEEDTMTEEQRMEEGRRMFQIFAARMFEQRVLTAYREKVAKERQEKLLEELADEETQETQRKAKKAKEAQKRKDKAAQKKQALAEEKARKHAEKAAEESRRREEEAKKSEEQRLKTEEKRKRREAERKASEEERRRKEAARIQRIQEQQDQERKARETKERDKKVREEIQLKQKETQEKKERETRERREKQERDKRDKEARAQANEARERQKQEEKASQRGKAATVVPAMPTKPPVPAIGPGTTPSGLGILTPITLARRPSQQQHANTVPVLPQQPPQSSSFSSPQVAAATPVFPKAPTPMRTRQSSQHGGSTGGSQSVAASRTASLSGSGQSQNASPNPPTPSLASPVSFGSVNASNVGLSNTPGLLGNYSQNHSLGQAVSPPIAPTKPALHQQAGSFSMGHSSMAIPFPLGITPVTLPPGLGLPAQYAPAGGGSFRVSGAPPIASSINGVGRGFGAMIPPPGFGNHMSQEQLVVSGPIVSPSVDNGGMQALHSRQSSAGFDPGSSPTPTTQPIARPTPIGRPGSVVHSQVSVSGSPGALTNSDETDSAYHLGSRALLDDSDFALDEMSRRPTGPPRPGFGASPGSFGIDLASPFVTQPSLWGVVPTTASSAFASGPPGFPSSLGGWGGPVNVGPFNTIGGLGRPSQASVTLRQILCRACRDMYIPSNNLSDPAVEGFIPIEAVRARIQALAPSFAGPGLDPELDVLYDTEGSSTNGGGNFDVQRDSDGLVMAIRWRPDDLSRRLGSIGDDSTGGDGTAAPIGTFTR